MTRASLLHLLAHPTALTGPDVRALEELAQAFPYCQTAHLLLAKAAHDQGSMLAAQRLRRAATYAADRAHLRQLIEAPVVAEPMLAKELAVSQAARPTSEPATDVAVDSNVEPLASPSPGSTESASQQEPIVLEDKPDQLLGQAEPAEEALASTLPTEAELPPQAPPIRPPAKAETARFEFGLAAEEPAEIMAYRLPELAEPAALAPEAAPLATPRLPSFGGVADVSYAPGEGSRLGFCLVPATSAALLPGSGLPPAGEFFAPDALVLAHLAAHQPATPKPSSLDLINSFLQRSPAVPRRRLAPHPSAVESDAQADLSVRSTRTEADLASENLAKILVRQGKIDRAIAVYERLMVKHPEKMAYFAAQIESLRPSA